LLVLLFDNFSAQSELRKQRGWAPAGTTPIVVNNDSLVDHYAVTLMVGFHAPPSQREPVFLDFRNDGMNTSCDFLSFVVGAVRMGFLVSGDVLICDNAKVHTAPLMTMHLKAFLEPLNIFLLYLPTYSPELNPCELVFANVKNDIRNHRDSTKHWFNEIYDRFRAITQDELFAMYRHCLDQ
jgi:transposase